MGLRGSINAKCRDCIYDEMAAGSAAVQIELCTAWTCPLWDVRPVRTHRLPFSAPVVAEMGMSAELAAWRAANPRVRPDPAQWAEMAS